MSDVIKTLKLKWSNTMKKTFDLNNIFNFHNKDKCLEEVLEAVVKEEQLDQQDIMDIVELASKNFTQLIQYYNGRKGGGSSAFNFPVQPQSGMFGPGVGLGMGRQYSGHGESPWVKTYLGEEYPEFFEDLFARSEFMITYHSTVLTDNFKFVGVDGKYLTYLGRDKELAKVLGSASFHYGRLEVRLGCQNTYGQMRIITTPATDDKLRQTMQDCLLPLPGYTPTSSTTRELMEHIRNQTWRSLTEGDLVVRIDEPGQVYILSHTVNDDPNQHTVSVIPVTITTNDEGIVATPTTSGAITTELVFLKRYKHQP